MHKRYTFKKQERLKRATIISQLFERGNSFGMYPLRLVWLEMEVSEKEIPLQVTFSVPKKKFKSAVDRNRIKRQMREAWRLNKHDFLEDIAAKKKEYACMILYTAKEPFPYSEIEKSTKRIMQKMLKIA